MSSPPFGAVARWLVGNAAIFVPRRHRERWMREWEAEIWHREQRLARDGAGSGRAFLQLVGPALGSFVHAGWLRIQTPGFDAARQDISFAVRSYRRSPGFTLAAVLTLGLGIAANVAVLAVIEGALLRPYAYEDAEDLAVLVNRDVERPDLMLGWSYPDVEAAEQSGALSSVMAADWDPFNLRLDDRTEWIGGGLVSSSMFETLGIQPIRGRGFVEGEDQPGAAPVVVLGERLWRQAFGAKEMIGETVWLDGQGYEVIGVAPAATDVPEGADLWVPLKPTGERLTRRTHWLQAYARLAPETEWSEAQATLDVVSSRLAAEFVDTNEGRSFEAIPLRDYRTGDLRPAFIALFSAVGLLLLIVCANLASLLLARSTNRGGEFGVRQALGASRGRLVRQMLTESLVLAGMGGLVGLAFGTWAVGALGRLVSEQPVWFAPTIDPSVVGFAIVLTFLSAALFGTAPLLAGAARELGRSVRGGRGSRRSRDVLVFAEVALSTVLLVASGLLIRSLSQITAVDPGFETEGRVSGTVQLPGARYDSDENVLQFVDRLIETTEARPDVASAAVVTRMPFRSGTNQVMWWEDGQHENAFRENPQAELNSVTPGYFETMGIEVRHGRRLEVTDDYDAEEVVVISETFAREFFGSRDPLGVRISFSYPPRFARVVGVAEDTKHLGLEQDARFQIYAPFAQRPTSRLTIIALARGEGGAVGAGLRQIVREADSDLAISGLSMVSDSVADSVWRLRLLTRLFWAFGVFALLLAAVGITGIVSQAVARRTREIGIRIALGAGAGQILALVSRRVGRVVLAGLVAGTGAAIALGRLAEGALYGVEPRDPFTFAVVVGGFALVGAIAAWVPARRAMSIDPANALRAD